MGDGLDITKVTLRDGLLHKWRETWSAEQIVEIWRLHFESMDNDPAYRARVERDLAVDGRVVIGTLSPGEDERA